MAKKNSSTIKKVIKAALLFLSIILLLILSIIYAIRFPSVQQFITSKAVNFYQNKTNTKANLSRLYIDFPSNITIEGLYLEDTKGDTLLYVDYLSAQTDLWELQNNKLHLSSVELSKTTGFVKRQNNDSTFNFQFIIDAFSSQEKTESDTTQSFDFSIEQVEIAEFRGKYQDDWIGVSTHSTIKNLSVVFEVFDLNKSTILVDQLALDGSSTKLYLQNPSKPSEEEDTKPETVSGNSSNDNSFYISGKTLSVSNSKFRLEDSPNQIKLYTDVSNLSVLIDSLDVENSIYKAEEIEIQNSFVSFDQFERIDNVGNDLPSNKDETSIIDEMVAGSALLRLQNSSFRYRDYSIDQNGSGFNPADLWLQEINVSLHEGYMQAGEISGVINELSVIEKGGLTLESLTGKVFYSDQKASLNQFNIKTNLTDIGGSISLNYPSIESISETPESLIFSADLRQSQVDLEDIYYFQPAFRKDLSFANSLDKISFKLNTSGSPADINVNSFYVKALSGTELSFKGRIQKMMDLKSINGHLDSMRLVTNKRDLTLVLTDSLLPADFNLPSNMKLTGYLSGGINSANFNLALNTSSGDIKINGKTELPKDSIWAYSTTIKTSQLEIGNLLGLQQVGSVTSDLKLQGRGLELEQLESKLEGQISKMTINGYVYKQLALTAEYSNKNLKTNLNLEDDNLTFDLDAEVNSVTQSPTYTGSLKLDRADFQAIGFTDQDLKLRANLNFKLNYNALNDLNGQVSVSNITFSNLGKVYSLDTISMVAETSAEMARLQLLSSVADMNFDGNFDFRTLPDVLIQHAGRYFTLNKEVSDENYKSQHFNFSIDLKNPAFISEILIPDLTSLNTGLIEGSYNSDELSINTTATIYNATYQASSIDSLFLEINSDSSDLKFKTKVKKLIAGGFEFNNISINAESDSNNTIKTNFQILDEEGEKRYLIGGKVGLEDSAYRFSLSQNEFMLNYENWTVEKDNYVEFLKNGFWIENLGLSKKNQRIDFNSKISDKGDSVLTAHFREFDMSFLGKGRYDSTSSIISGKLNGEVSMYKESLFADITAKNLGYKGDTIGTINLQAENQNKTTELTATIKGKLNEVLVNGEIIENEKLNLVADFKSVNLSSLESLSANALSDMKGSLNGKLKVTGTFSKPYINGRLNFDEAGFKINYLGSSYTVNDGIDFNNSGLKFNNFKIRDAQGDQLNLNGTIETTDYQSFSFGIKLNASNFQLLNTDQSNNDLIYGKLGISSTADITGTLASPKIRTSLSIEPKSDITYVIPESEIEVQNRKGIVEFFDSDVEDDEFFGKVNSNENDSSETQWVKGIDLKANIDLTNSSVFRIVIDPVNKDQLTVAGDADLAYSLKPDGSMTLTGRYEVTSGSYDLNFYGIAKRKFDIQSGSYLLWTGDPMNARLNVDAAYEVRAVPAETDVSQKLPFIVNLNIGGELLKPDISFRLNLKERGGAASSVQAWLASVNQQESVLNKQVFSLLLFKSFLPTGSSAGNNNSLAGTAARNSVSNILTNQLNKLGSRIKGLELSFDLESYETMNTSGENVGSTELELGLQKQFFNNRVVVKVAGNVDLEGERRSNQSASDFAGDIKVEYKLTEDGRFRLIGFRQNEYDDLLQGDIAKTGVGIIFVRDYSTLKELFSKVDKEEREEGADNE